MLEEIIEDKAEPIEPIEEVGSHYWLATLEILHSVEGKLQRTSDNMFVTSAAPYINAATLDHTRFMYLQQFTSSRGVKPEDIKSFTFINLSHLGYMTDAQFQEIPLISE